MKIEVASGEWRFRSSRGSRRSSSGFKCQVTWSYYVGPWGQKEVYELDVDNLIDLQYIHLYSLNLAYVGWMGDLNKLAENLSIKMNQIIGLSVCYFKIS